MKVDFVIFYEHESRELESCMLLKANLEARGYQGDVIKVLSYKHCKYRLFTQPTVIFVPYCYTEQLMDGFVPCMSRENCFIDLQLEQIFSKRWNEIGWYKPSGDAKKAIHICWGEKSQERLISYGLEDSNCPVTGAIHLDFLQTNMRKMYFDKNELGDKFNIPRDKKWILYISSFAYTNPKGISIEQLKDDVTRNKNTNTGLSGEYFETMVDLQKASKEKTLQWFNRYLSESSDDSIIIYRAHPAEAITSNEISELKNKYPGRFFTNSQLSIRQWIFCSDVITTWFSTSIVEAYFAKKQCIILRPFPIRDEYDCIVYENCRPVDNYKGFLQSIQEENDISNFPVDIDLMNSFYSNNISGEAVERICDVFESAKNNIDVHLIKHKPNIQQEFKELIKLIIFSAPFYWISNCIKPLISEKRHWIKRDEEDRTASGEMATYRRISDVLTGKV